ncbi:MucR family transcriptional regulator [soil metagenome]
MTDHSPHDVTLLEMTVGIVANYVGANKVDPAAIPNLIGSIHASLSSLDVPKPDLEDAKPERLTPSQIRKLVTRDGIISLITQQPFKSMKRHLSTHGYTPETYREHFGLPSDFPIVHPDYAAARSALAKKLGLGQGGRKPKNHAKPVRKAKQA